MREPMNRREFLGRLGAATAGTAMSGYLAALAGCAAGGRRSLDRIRHVRLEGRKAESTATELARPIESDLVVVKTNEEKNYGAALKKALDEVGGIRHFVKPGDKVCVTPNIAWARTPGQAANVHPEVLRALVLELEKAGARKVTCVDYTLDPHVAAFDVSGANDAVRGTMAVLKSPNEEKYYREVEGFEKTKAHSRFRIVQKICKDIIKSDVFICVPQVKDHEAAVVTIAMKKLMGCIWDRKSYHRTDLHQCIADLNQVVRPTLIIADATRVLQTRGPKGPGETTTPHDIVVGFQAATVDAYCCRYLTVKSGSDDGLPPSDVPHLVCGEEYGLGSIDPNQWKVREVTV